MGLLNLRRIGPLAYLVAAASTLVLSPATAQAPIKFSLDSRIEGPDALILLPLDRGYFKSRGLDVSVDDAARRSTDHPRCNRRLRSRLR